MEFSKYDILWLVAPIIINIIIKISVSVLETKIKYIPAFAWKDKALKLFYYLIYLQHAMPCPYDFK